MAGVVQMAICHTLCILLSRTLYGNDHVSWSRSFDNLIMFCRGPQQLKARG